MWTHWKGKNLNHVMLLDSKCVDIQMDVLDMVLSYKYIVWFVFKSFKKCPVSHLAQIHNVVLQLFDLLFYEYLRTLSQFWFHFHQILQNLRFKKLSDSQLFFLFWYLFTLQIGFKFNLIFCVGCTWFWINPHKCSWLYIIFVSCSGLAQ